MSVAGNKATSEKLEPPLEPRAAPVAGPWVGVPETRRVRPTWVEPDVGRRVAKPFIKWAGGKRKLVPHLLRYVPQHIRAYHEPFVGGGALFYELKPSVAYLTDANERLVRTYRGVRDDVDGVIHRLGAYPHDQEFYLKFRRKDVDVGRDADVAAWLIYLNKTGFNGLYRVNRKNEFNVPFGSHTNPTICDEENLRACARLLRRTDVALDDFTGVLKRARRGDFVYFDPPYMPLSVSSSFVSYTKGGFGPEDHRRLRDVALALKRKGVTVLLSNSSHPLIRELYAEHFIIEEVMAARAINSRADRRGPVRELLIR